MVMASTLYDLNSIYVDMTSKYYTAVGKNAFYNLKPKYFTWTFATLPALSKKKPIFLGPMSAHHIIPLDVFKLSAVTGMLTTLTTEGLFSVIDGVLNLVHLPTTPRGVAPTGLALHSSSHKVYSAKVLSALQGVQNNVYSLSHTEAAAVIGGIQ
jgi:A nuclease family of the HNH/ENDO VII superfamily with conserved AHH